MSVPVVTICQTAPMTWPISGLRPANSVDCCSRRASNGAHTAASSSAFAATYASPVGGEPEGTAAPLVVGLDQPLVLELLDGRVHRSGARAPGAVGAVGDLLDDLVAVDRLAVLRGLADHVEDGGAHVAPAYPRAALLLALREAEEAGHPRRRAGVSGLAPGAGSAGDETAPAPAAVLVPLLLGVARPLPVESLVSHLTGSLS